MNPKIDNYLAVGCGRCPLGGTPQCKVHNWDEELAQLRTILLDSELTEELKWRVPCYTFEGKNVLILTALKDYCTLSFFKGVLLKDEAGILVAQTENMQAERIIKFTGVDEIVKMTDIIKAYINEAIEIEKAGLEVEYKQTSDFEVPEELRQKFEEDPYFKTAFKALTQGRQRGYLLHFSGAKQSKTRISRIEKHVQNIIDGRGLHDR